MIVSNDAGIAQKLNAIAFPGMTANFDAAKSAALAVCMLDWRDFGQSYAAEMTSMSQHLDAALQALGLPVFSVSQGMTGSHQFALDETGFGGGQAASKILLRAGFLACGIGLPLPPVEGDMNGLRFGTPELVRWGMNKDHCERLAWLIARASQGEAISSEVSDWRASFDRLHFIH